MEKKRCLIIVLLFGLVSLLMFSDELEIEYVEGSVDYFDGSQWRMAEIGEVVGANYNLRLSGSGVIELRGLQTQILINEPGEYKVQDLIESQERLEKIGLSSLLWAKASKVFSVTESDQTTAAGVRGFEGGTTTDEMSMYSLEDHLLEGRNFLVHGEYERALSHFQDALELSYSPSDSEEIQFYIGYTKARMGDIRGAYAIIHGLTVNKNVYYYPEYIFLKAKLSFQTNAFAEAKIMLSEYLSQFGSRKDEDAHMAELLLAMSYNELGDKTQALKLARELSGAATEATVRKLAEKLVAQIEG